MADPDSADVLQDLRQKRLAYFQSHSDAPASQTITENDQVPSTQPQVSAKIGSGNLTTTTGSYDGQKDDFDKNRLTETFDTSKHKNSVSYEYKDNPKDDVKNAQILRQDPPNGNSLFEANKAPPTKTVKAQNVYDTPGNDYFEKFTSSASIVSDIVDVKTNGSSPVPHGHLQAKKTETNQEMDGYNETVERLIRATKEELLGKKASDDIWNTIIKVPEKDNAQKVNYQNHEKHSSGISKGDNDFVQKSVDLSNVISNTDTSHDYLTRNQDQFENSTVNRSQTESHEAIIESAFTHEAMKPPKQTTNYIAKSLPAKNTGMLEPTTSKQVNRRADTNHYNLDSEKVEAIFSSRQTPWSNPSASFAELKESHDLDVPLEKNVDESLNLSDLGLSTHRPEADSNRESVQASDLNLGDTITMELRTVLGEEKFQQFLCKAKREIDDLHETRSDRSVRKDKTPRLIKDSNTKLDNSTIQGSKGTSAPTETKSKKLLRQASEPAVHSQAMESTHLKTKRQISSADARNRQNTPASTDFKPRLSDGEVVSNIIEKNMFDRKENNEPKVSTTTPKPAVKSSPPQFDSKDSTKVTIPELNLSEIHKSESPRPKLNRPKHEPFIIYPENSKSNSYSQQDSPKSDVRKNYEQVPVAKTVVFSADEIYSQAYGSLYQSQPEFHQLSSHPLNHQHATQQYHPSMVGSQNVSGHAFNKKTGEVGVKGTVSFTVPLTPTTPVFSGGHVNLEAHGTHNFAPLTPATSIFSGSHEAIGAQHFSPLTPTTHVFPGSQDHHGTHGGQHFTPRQTHAFPTSNIKQMGELARFQQYMSSSVPIQAQPLIQVPHPPSQPFQNQQIQQVQQNQGSMYNPHLSQDFRANPNIMTHAHMSTSPPQYNQMGLVPHPPSIPDHSHLKGSGMMSTAYSQDVVLSSHSMMNTPQTVMMPQPPTADYNNQDSTENHIRQPVESPPAPKSSSAEVQMEKAKQGDNDKVTIVEESTFTSVSQIQDNDVKIPHPPMSKKTSKPSPRKPIKGQDPKRHIDGIRQHHEQRRQEHEEAKLTDEEILARQRKFAKASIDRYFASLENLYVSSITGKPSHLQETIESNDEADVDDDDGDVIESAKSEAVLREAAKVEALRESSEIPIQKVASIEGERTIKEAEHTTESGVISKSVETSNVCDEQTVVNSEFTSVTVNAGGVTERLEELGVHVSHSGENFSDRNNNNAGHKKQIKRGKKLLVCPECQGLNKEYMSWCTHCGEMIIGVEPKLVSKTRDGKLRIKPINEKDDIVTKLNTINTNTQSAEVNYIQEIPDKPFSLNLEDLKTEEREAHVDPKNVSPIKSDGKDSGRPSSEDRENELHVQTADDEIVHDTNNDSNVHNNAHFIQTKSHFNDSQVFETNQMKSSSINFGFRSITSEQKVQHSKLDTDQSSRLWQDELAKQSSKENSNHLLLKEEVDNLARMKNAHGPTQLNYDPQTNKEWDMEKMSVADRVKQIESERETQLKSDNVTNVAQGKNTPTFTGDLAMDSIGASYLIMSKKHDSLKSQLHMDDDKGTKGDIQKNKILKSKESHTSVFELTADKVPSNETVLMNKTAEFSTMHNVTEEKQSKLEITDKKHSDLQSKENDKHVDILEKIRQENLQGLSCNSSNNYQDKLESINNDKEVIGDSINSNIVVENIKHSPQKGSYRHKVKDNIEVQTDKHLSSNFHVPENEIDDSTAKASVDIADKVPMSDIIGDNEVDIAPPLPAFSTHVPVTHNELALKLPANSMDLSMDYSHVGSLSYEALDEFKTEEEIQAIKEEKKKERRRKRGHGAIDVEVFGIEEMRESRNSSRGQRLVPVLNLAGNSSDEDDFSVQSDTKSDLKPDVSLEPAPHNMAASTSAWEPANIPELPPFQMSKSPDLEMSSRSPDTSARPLNAPSTNAVQQPGHNMVSESNEDWKTLFNPQPVEEAEQPEQEDHDGCEEVDLDQPFLEQVLKHDKQPVKSKNRPTSAKSKNVKSKVRQSIEEPGYKRKWARSSTAWSSYNVGELNTSSSLRSSTDSQRPASAPKSRNLSPNKSKDSSALRPLGKRPLSADVKTRLSQNNADASTSSPGNQPSREQSPYRLGSRSGHLHDNQVSTSHEEGHGESPIPVLHGAENVDIDVNDEVITERMDDMEVRLDDHAIGNPGQAPIADGPDRPPYRLWLEKDKKTFGAGQWPQSATKSKGKPSKHKKKSGNHSNDLDLSVDLVTIEHRLPKPGVLEWLSAMNEEADNSDLMAATSPKSTYDKYLEMTPRIEAGTISRWQCLPDEILLHVFAYLDQTSLTKCAQVCHQFYRVAMDESLWKYITVKKRNNMTDECLTEISKRHPVSLALIQCQGEQVTAKGLRDLFRECSPTLKELNISRCSKGALQGDSLLLHAAARCNNVTHIDASWCNVTDSGLMAISNTVDRLESLCINGCQAISDDGLETIIKKHGSHLRVLEMFGCFNITPRGLRCISNNCINLLSINLGNCYKLTDSCIAQLSASLGRTESLDLRGCKQIKDNSIRRVVKNCPRLKNLSLANCPNITDVSLLEISTYLTDIRCIDLCGCKKVTDNSIRALVNTCVNLREIDISSTGCTHRSVSMIANFSGQRLETLKINFLSDVTEQSLIKLAKHCRRLKSVHMYGCPSNEKNWEKCRETWSTAFPSFLTMLLKDFSQEF